MMGKRFSFEFHGHSVSFLATDGNTSTLPMFFLHGWGGNAESWQPLWHALAKLSPAPSPHLSLYALDFPGFGASSPPPTAWQLEDFVHLVIAFLDHLHIPKIVLVGHSFGGRVGMVLAAQYPDRIAELVLLAPAGLRHHRVVKKIVARAAEAGTTTLRLSRLRGVRTFFRLLLHRALGNPEYARTSGVMRQTYQRAVERDLRSFLPAITVPVRIFWGRHDTYVPVGDAAIMERALPSSRVVIFENGRHGIHVSHASEIAAALCARVSIPVSS